MASRGRKPLEGQLPLWTPESEWRPPAISDLPSWAQARRVGIDLETKDPHLKELGPGVRRPGAEVVGYSFTLEDGPSLYVPVAHAGGDNVPEPEAAWRYLRDQARTFRGEIVGAHLMHDLDWLLEYRVKFPVVTAFRDVQVADPLICELHQKYSLGAIAERRGLPGKNEDLLRDAARHFNVDAKSGMWQLPARFVGPYAGWDSELPLKILRRQERDIEEQDLWDIWELESRLLPVLVRMRRRGVRVSEDRLSQIETWSIDQEREALEKVHHLTGRRIEVGSVWTAAALAPALEAIGIDVPKKFSRGRATYSIDKEFLGSVDHPVADALAWARKVNKLRTTFAASIRKHIISGRIHTTFNQLRRTKEDGDTVGAAYGRLSSENPNMQQQPARDEFAAMWRSIYLPEEGALWGAADYSQQEPRWLVHFAELTGLPGAEVAAQRYRDDPLTDNHDMMTRIIHGEDVMEREDFKKLRFDAKQLLLGTCYGQGGAKTARVLGLPTRWAVFYRGWQQEAQYFESRAEAIRCARETDGRAFEVAGEEAQAIISTFNDRMPFVKGMARATEQAAKKRGYIRTVGGRRCRFPMRDDGSYDWTHKALNRLIQGSSADQMKRALVEGDAAGHFLQLQVHDEADGSFPSEEAARGMARIMLEVYPSRVPHKIDLDLGPSWGEAKTVAEVTL